MSNSTERRRKRTKAALRMLPEEEPEFQIAPMIDILLVMLVFFMSISSSEVLEASREIQLPVAEDTKKDEGDNPGEIKINIDWNQFANTGAIEIKQQQYATADEIKPILAKSFAANPLLRVLVRADKDVLWDYTRSVLKAVGEVGISKVVFSVVNKEMADATAATTE
jgi:biopolymer transport protein ExbD